MQRSLTHETLGDLDGGSARLIIDAAIREALADIDDRGSDELPRKVEIHLTLKQMKNGLTTAEVDAFAKLPRRRTAATVCEVRNLGGRRSQLLFQDGAPDDPRQRTIDETYQSQTEE